MESSSGRIEASRSGFAPPRASREGVRRCIEMLTGMSEADPAAKDEDMLRVRVGDVAGPCVGELDVAGSGAPSWTVCRARTTPLLGFVGSEGGVSTSPRRAPEGSVAVRFSGDLCVLGAAPVAACEYARLRAAGSPTGSRLWLRR